ncbi:hypothetical protein BVJ53_05690 [Lacticaseibacillus chiayiensis]|uniref:Schlafen group 3-like DNA/RNA helicase domain-containing protein n=1 Tax=Lacticaseibacillus chiayiensis TaxID=2100821 RepID=A0A4Q1U5I1_9LACO|nr:hypothetical protein [Lacticaseibacillus chiayiensis]RXT26844.1 hypothetical protein BVJ53_05690 [Lacticaseibacillus chiayiensis]
MTPFSLREYLAISENPALLNDALKYHRMTQKSKESEDFRAFLSVLSESLDKAKDIDGWFLGTDLGVVPDFDVLWYGQKFVLNINLKHVWLSTMSKKTVRTFKTQARIFRLLSPDLLVCNIVFDAHEKTFFKLENDSLIEISVNYLLKLMNGKNGLQQNQVANLSSSSFLISPLTDTEGFLSDKYWLAEDQESIKQVCSQPGVFGVQGKAGSGKSLIAFDLAKSLNGKKMFYLFFLEPLDLHTNIWKQYLHQFILCLQSLSGRRT